MDFRATVRNDGRKKGVGRERRMAQGLIRPTLRKRNERRLCAAILMDKSFLLLFFKKDASFLIFYL